MKVKRILGYTLLSLMFVFSIYEDTVCDLDRTEPHLIGVALIIALMGFTSWVLITDEDTYL